MARHYPYLIIGGGMAADAAARGIRQVDANGSIGLISQESDPPYNRPPLSKGLWKRMPVSRIWRNTAGLGVELHLGRTAVTLDAGAQRVTDDQGDEYTFDQLLLATGGEPIRLAPDSERLAAFRTLADYRRLRLMTETGQRFGVIGGGFIGSEVAAVLAAQGKEVTMIFPEDGIGARVLPQPVSQYLNGYFRERGVRVLAGEWVRGISSGVDAVQLQTDRESLSFDGVVAGLGIRPNLQLAQMAGLDTGSGALTGKGIVVDGFMRTNHPRIYAAGDVTLFYSPVLERWMRVEHEEHANLSGMAAGLNMAGQPSRYEHLPSVYSSMFDLHYDAVGELDPSHEIVYDWQEPYQKGAVFYRSGSQVRGVLLWNIYQGLEKARALIAAPEPHTLKGLFT